MTHTGNPEDYVILLIVVSLSLLYNLLPFVFCSRIEERPSQVVHLSAQMSETLFCQGLIAIFIVLTSGFENLQYLFADMSRKQRCVVMRGGLVHWKVLRRR